LKATAGVAIAAIGVALLWPAYVGYLERDAGIAENARIDIPGIPGKWKVSTTQLSDWKPRYVGTPVQFLQTYENGSRSVSIYIAEYRNQRPGSQLITSGNVLVSDNAPGWHVVSEQIRSVDIGPQPLTIRQNQMHSPSKKLLIWRWYRLAAAETTSPYLAKIILAKHKLLARDDDGAEIIVAAQFEDKPDEAVPVLQAFLNDMMPAIRKGLADAAGQ
jgi:EpsI family protein